jgi:hypothetical protein
MDAKGFSRNRLARRSVCKRGGYFELSTGTQSKRSPISSEIEKLRRQFKVKKILAYSSVFFVAMMVALSASAAGTDFSGTWKLDASKSTMPQGPGGGGGGGDVTLTVKQDAKTLTATRTTARGEQVTTYNLDGSESSSEGRMGKSKHTTKWQSDGKILEINTTTNANIQGNEMTITSVAHWELADGGKTLKIHSKTSTPQGDRESNQVFVKQ